MPSDLTALVNSAAAIFSKVEQGERASAALSLAISAGSLMPEEAERLAQLVYTALRNAKRVAATLAELRGERGSSDPKRLVVAAALLGADDAVAGDAAALRALAPSVPWERFLELDATRLERAQGAEKVALLGSLPDFLATELWEQYGAEAEPLAASLSEPAPRSLRVNALKADVAEARERLEREGARISPGRHAKRAFTLEGAFNPFVTKAFHDGLFELQDEGSQIACELVAPPPRGLVVDACAGAGGKSLAIAAALEGRGKLIALDIDAQKLGELRRRAKRAGAANVQALELGEAGQLPEQVLALQGKVDRLLIDAPCTGTGVLRRNPETRLRLTPGAALRLAETQRAIVDRMLPLLAPGGRLVFVTCSLLAAEGEQLVGAVEQAHPELEPVNLAEIYDRAYVERFSRSAPNQLRLLPHLHGTDGFFIGVLRRRRS